MGFRTLEDLDTSAILPSELQGFRLLPWQDCLLLNTPVFTGRYTQLGRSCRTVSGVDRKTTKA
jgi:hypothetical protein